jgi:hypothetical protein
MFLNYQKHYFLYADRLFFLGQQIILHFHSNIHQKMAHIDINLCYINMAINKDIM